MLVIILSTMPTRLVARSESRATLNMVRFAIILILSIVAGVVRSSVTRISHDKCCLSGQVLDDNLTCVRTVDPPAYRHTPLIKNTTKIFSCNNNQTLKPITTKLWSHYLEVENLSGLVYCLEYSINKSLMIQICPSTMSGATRQAENVTGCDGILTKTKFWGADIAMHMNIVHIVLCFIVVIFYRMFYDLGRRTYNRAVLQHNACLLTMGCTLTTLGVFTLCHSDLNGSAAVFLWLVLQFFTLASTFWLNVICFDMTLVITRFRWMFGSFDNSEREENRKFLVYGIFAWGGALIPTLFAGIMELCPEGSVHPALRADYARYKEGDNRTVNMYFFFIPLITLFFNNILFIYTSYKIFMIQRSTAIVTKNQTNALWRKYFLFLRLYLLMGAPWFFGVLMACLNQLWILKTCRIVQPILWLLMLASHKKVRRRIVDRLGKSDHKNQSCDNCEEE